MKLIVLIIIGILGITCASIVYTFLSDEPPEKKDYSEGKFYGPVQEGYNQTHYWKTGETIKEEIKR